MAIPWWGKFGLKIAVSMVPLPARIRHRIGINRQGQMHEALYARSVIDHHLERAGMSSHLDGRSILELGPGDGLATALLVRAYGGRSVLVDAAPLADMRIATYQRMSRVLLEKGLKVPDIASAATIGEMLEQCRSRYLTDGLQSLRSLPADSFDLVFSHAVLQAVRRDEFSEILSELRRVLKPGGISSHNIDLRDYLGSSINSLRFSDALWESRMVARSGTYTNRLRCSEILAAMQQAGFETRIVKKESWQALPVPVRDLAKKFQHCDADDLLTHTLHVRGVKRT